MAGNEDRRPMRPHQATIRARLLATSVSGFIKILAKTLRYDTQGVHPFLEEVIDRPFIIAIWHNRLALSLPLYQRMVARSHPPHRMAALVSASRDGAMLAHILTSFSVRPVRGSSSKRGVPALKELVRCARDGWDIAVTPDGPRGPKYQLQEGVITSAQLTGLPILPVSYHLKSKLTTKSWDGFQIPLPLTRCTVLAAKPLEVPRSLTPDQRHELRAQLQQRLDSITRD